MSPEATIAHYRITGKLGEGGMGEVYRARDTKLNRDVAIKILPEAFAQDADRMARFTREAQVLASLNHPNIAAIYGVEERALVMELVEGEALRGPLPLETAMEYARQLAEALEAAHEKGIVHRDLKPANIKVTPEGVVKVLDFGLAKAAEPAGDPGSSLTLTMSPTRAGMIMGTAAYMSPEQARGKPVDKRADIWAFGVVLYELLTGEPLYSGETVSDTLAAVLTREPDWNRVPAKVRRLLQRCLEKDPKRRLRDIADALALADEAPQISVTKTRMPWAAVAGALGIALVIALWAPWRAANPPAKPRPLLRLDVDLGSAVSLSSLRGTDVVVSPDGSRIVYCSKTRLYTRRLGQSKVTELVGKESPWSPFFSPDGQWVAFFTLGKLKKVSVEGGAAVPLCDAPTGMGGSWGPDDNMIVSLSPSSFLSRVGASSSPTAVSKLGSGEVAHRWPQILPGGKAVLFTTLHSNGVDDADVEVLTLADGQRKILQRGGTFGRLLPTGHLLYVRQGTLFAVPFDLGRLQVRGTAVPVVEEVAYNTLNGSAQFDFPAAWNDTDRSGLLVYRGKAGSGSVTVQLLDSTGHMQPLLGKPGEYRNPRLSPEGDRLAIGFENDIWVYDLRREAMTRLTSGGAHVYPIWTRDGRYIVFSAQGEGIFWIRADGAAQPQPLIRVKTMQLPWSFTPDGKQLAIHGIDPESGLLRIWTMAVESDDKGLRAHTPAPFLRTSFFELSPNFSPDGHWLAYSSNEAGTEQVYVRAFPDASGKVMVSTNGGRYPVWSRSRNELFFRSPDNQVMVAGYSVKGDSFAPDKPRLWSGKVMADTGIGSRFDVTPDGQHVVALMPVEDPEARRAESQAVFLLNFFDELRRRVPVGGAR